MFCFLDLWFTLWGLRVNFTTYDFFSRFLPQPRPSMCTRLLFSVLPSPYSKKTFHKLLQVLTDDLIDLETKGLTVSPPLFVYIFHFCNVTVRIIYGHLEPIGYKTLCSEDSTSEVSWKGTSHHFRFVMIATKGDWPFLRSAYSPNCGFNCRDKCHRCDVREPYQKNWNHFICLWGPWISNYIWILHEPNQIHSTYNLP